MIIRPLSTSIAALYHLPDTEAAPAGGASPAPSAPAAGKTPAASPAPPAPKPAAPLKAEPKVKGVLSISKALKLDMSPKKANDEEAARIAKQANPGMVIELPEKKAKDGEEGDDKGAPPIKKKADPKVEPEPTGQEPPPEPEPEPEVKIKIGGKEMTQKEAEKYIADLERKAEKVKPPEPKVEKTPAQIAAEKQQEAAEAKRLDDEWIEKNADAIGFDQATFDKALADGDVKAFNRKLAEVALQTRKSLIDQVQPILNDLYERATPAWETHQEIARLTSEQTFLAEAANADLVPYRSRLKWADDLMRTRYPEEYAKTSPAERLTAAATNVRNLIKEGLLQPDAASPNAAPAPKPAAPATPPAPKPPKPAPPTGNLGGTAAPVKTTKAGGLISRLEGYKRNG